MIKTYIMRKLSLLLFMLIGISFYGQSSDEKLNKLVHELGNRMEEMIPKGDLDGIMAMYSEGARYLPDNFDQILVGKEAIRMYWEKTLNYLDVFGFEMTPVTIEKNNNMIYETGNGVSKFKYQGSDMELTFKYMNVWRKENGKYVLIMDMYNDRPIRTEK